MQAEYEVFIVDDDAAVRDSLTALIESAGFKVESFESAEAFIASYDPTRKGCLLVDVRMPGMSGLDLQRMLKDEQEPIPVIILTGHADIPMAVQAIKQGAVDFIEKPYHEDRLMEGIGWAMDIIQRESEHGLSAREAATRIARLTPREREVFDKLVGGNPNKGIARELGISPRTVEIHRSRVMEKLQSHSLAQIIRTGIAAGVDPNGS